MKKSKGKLMKKLILVLVFGIVLSLGAVMAEGENYGKEITLSDQTKISDILAKPEDFVGKRVLVSGTIVGVCGHRGCWIELASDKDYETIRVKVTDGEIVFPMTSKGKTARVEGEVYKIELTKEQTLACAKHDCEAAGKKFDPKDVKGPRTIYQIKGIGAVIK